MMREVEFPPHVLREYAFVADGERGAIVGPKGDIAWMCVPRWDSDSVFATLMGGAGVYSVSPSDPWSVWGGYYERGTLIWHSRWATQEGILESRDALAFPGDPSTVVILRRLMAFDEPAAFDAVLDVRAGFGRSSMRDIHKEAGTWTGRSGPLHFRWTGAGHIRSPKNGRLEMHQTVHPGEHHDLILEISASSFAEGPPSADELWRETEHAWSSEVPDFDHLTAARDARHAYAVMRGLTSRAGGMVAAATLGLPERAEGNRNYDYRYAWIRDQCFAGQAAGIAGGYGLLDNAVRFVSERLLEDGPQMKPAYRDDGSRVPDEHDLKMLSGYPGGRPKSGNWVNRQFQLDSFGEALLLLAEAGRHDRLDVGHWKAVEEAVSVIEARWTEPDAGIWEIDDRRWAHSRLTCVAGLRSIGRVGPRPQSASWTALADRIAADAGKDCVHPSGRWQRAPDDPRVDAALLLPGLRGAYPCDDPRHLATVDAVLSELGRDGYVYRFRHDDRPLEDAEGAFLLCGFLAALVARQLGRREAAYSWFERNRASCGPPGLFTEEYDVTERQLRGNLPQAFVHALLLECAAGLEPAYVDASSEG